MKQINRIIKRLNSLGEPSTREDVCDDMWSNFPNIRTFDKAIKIGKLYKCNDLYGIRNYEDTITLGQFIAKCKHKNLPNFPVYYYHDYGISSGIESWRGVYDELALDVASDYDKNIKPLILNEFILMLEECNGETYDGYKGGEFTMNLDTKVWVDNYGESSNPSTTIQDVIHIADKIFILTCPLDEGY